MRTSSDNEIATSANDCPESLARFILVAPLDGAQVCGTTPDRLNDNLCPLCD